MVLPFFDYLPNFKWTFSTLNADKNGQVWTTYPPHLVHVVIERPMASLSYWSAMVSHWTTICVISLCTFVNIVKDSLTQGRRNIKKNLDISLIGGHNMPTSIGIGLNFLSQIVGEQHCDRFYSYSLHIFIKCGVVTYNFDNCENSCR